MMTFVHKYNTRRVVVYTINTDRSLTAHHTVESYMLIGVCKQTTCLDSVASKYCRNGNKN